MIEGPSLQHLAGGRDGCPRAGQLAQLFVVEDQAVDPADDLLQLLTGDVDPQIHRVQGDEFRRLALRADLELKPRLDVGQEQHIGLT